jgi:hypothetical protein
MGDLGNGISIFSIPQIYDIQGDRKKLVSELWDKDDKMLGADYNEEVVKHLKSNVATLDEQIAVLESRPEIHRGIGSITYG